jgi:hypothetical protein
MPLEKADTSTRRWFEEATQKTDPGEPYRVRHVVPARYATYAKILHPIYELSEVSDRDLTWDRWERTRREERRRSTGESAELPSLEKLTTWRGSPETMDGARRVQWRTLTERNGMAYVPELSHWSFRSPYEKGWPRYLAGPQEGSLDPVEAWALLECLRPHADEGCRFWFSWSDHLLEDGEATEGVVQGSLRDLADAMVAKTASWPTAIWPLDEGWFVGSDVDLDFTLIGGPRALVDAVLGASELEAFEVSPSLRIDRDADTVNT